VMSRCLNAHRDRLRVPSNLDLSSEFDLIASHPAERTRFSIGFPLFWCPSRPVTEPGKGQMGNMSKRWSR
jgi:hypothetical protein